MSETNVLLDYKGPFAFGIIEELLNRVRESMEKLDLQKSTRKRVFNVLVECLENIYKYTGLDPEGNYVSHEYQSKVTLEQNDQLFIITTGNTILNSSVENLKEKIDMANQMDRDALKAKYAEIIDDGYIHDKGGAGLGIIDMVLKSHNRLQYRITPVNDVLSFYELIITINNENTD